MSGYHPRNARGHGATDRDGSSQSGQSGGSRRWVTTRPPMTNAPGLQSDLMNDATFADYFMNPDMVNTSQEHRPNAEGDTPSQGNPSPGGTSRGGSAHSHSTRHGDGGQSQSHSFPTPAPVIAPQSSEDTRTRIQPMGADSFSPSIVVKSILDRCIHTDYKDHWAGVDDADQETRERWFKNFQKLYAWDPQHNEVIRRNFRAKCSDLVRKALARMRKYGTRPSFLTPEGAAKLNEFYDNDTKWKAISEQNKKNASGSSGKGHNRHRNGPKPTHYHAQQMALDLGREPTSVELYKRLKIGKDGGFLDADGQELLSQLEEAHGKFLNEHPDVGHIDPATSARLSEPILGTSSRTGLPKVIGSAASLVPGTQWNYHTPMHVGAYMMPSQDFSRSQNEMLSQLGGMTDSLLQRYTQQVTQYMDQRLAASVAESVAESRRAMLSEVDAAVRRSFRGAFAPPPVRSQEDFGDDRHDLDED